jgi:peroxiredoxin Q/BCP
MSEALIIDDNRSTADALLQMLTLLHVPARVAYGSSAALSVLAGFTPRLILLDITMPGVDGLEVLGFLRREPRLADVPVVVITSDDQPETRDRAYKRGANAMIIKPATLDVLEGQLSRLGVLKPKGAPPGLLPAAKAGIAPAAPKERAAIAGRLESPLAAGSLAPDFELADDGGIPRRLSDYRGRPLVLYFYPADDTPGCTREACNFRDDYSAYQGGGVAILGVSPDSAQSHRRFRSKYGLPFPLLADVDHKTCAAYGVWGRKQLLGRTYEGVLRTTFLIDPAGKIARVFEKVRPAEHSAEILQALKSL